MNAPQLLTAEQAAKILDLSPKTLHEWRSRPYRGKGRDLPYIKVAGEIRYDMTDLVAWIESHKVKPVSG